MNIPYRIKHPETAKRNFELLDGPAGNVGLDVIFLCMDLYALHCEKHRYEDITWHTATALTMMYRAGYIKGKQDERKRRHKKPVEQSRIANTQ